MTNPNSPEQLPNREELDALVARANLLDLNAIAELRAWLARYPQVWRETGDLAQYVQATLIQAIAGKNQLLAQSLHHKLKELSADLQGSRPSVLEKLASERVLACWLETQFFELRFPADAGDNLPMAKYILQAKQSAQRRFESALRSLVMVQEKVKEANRLKVTGAGARGAVPSPMRKPLPPLPTKQAV